MWVLPSLELVNWNHIIIDFKNCNRKFLNKKNCWSMSSEIICFHLFGKWEQSSRKSFFVEIVFSSEIDLMYSRIAPNLNTFFPTYGKIWCCKHVRVSSWEMLDSEVPTMKRIPIVRYLIIFINWIKDTLNLSSSIDWHQNAL